MGNRFPPDIDRLIREQMVSGQYESEDDVLCDALQALAERSADLAAIQAGIDDMKAGRMKPLAEVDAEIRRRRGLPPRR